MSARREAKEHYAAYREPYDWEPYYRGVNPFPPEELRQAVRLFYFFNGPPRGSEALDLGSGSGRDVRFLLRSGFSVTALDNSDAALRRLKRIRSRRLCVIHATFNEMPAREYHLVNAQASLPYCGEEMLRVVMQKIYRSLAPQGLFVADFFGDEHDFNIATNSAMNFWSSEELLTLLRPLEILSFNHQRGYRVDRSGVPKYWDIYSVTARNNRITSLRGYKGLA